MTRGYRRRFVNARKRKGTALGLVTLICIAIGGALGGIPGAVTGLVVGGLLCVCVDSGKP